MCGRIYALIQVDDDKAWQDPVANVLVSSNTYDVIYSVFQNELSSAQMNHGDDNFFYSKKDDYFEFEPYYHHYCKYMIVELN